MNRSLIFFIITFTLLQGCQSTSVKKQTIAPEPTPYVAGEFNQESLYELMLAEIAGQRRLFPVALENYLSQTEKTRDPSVAERTTRIAQYLRNSEKIIQSAKLWRDIAPENPEPYQIEANMHLHKGNYAGALPLIKKALEYDALRTLALIRGQSEKMDAQVITGYVSMLEEHKKSNEPRADLELTLALLLRASNQKDKALIAFNRALSIDPENPEALIQKAELLRADKDLNGALSLIQAAYEQQPNNRQLHILYTQLLFQTKQPTKAALHAEKLLEKNAADHQLTYYLALLLLENEQLESAQKAFKHLLILRPEDSAPHFYLGHISQSLDNLQEAISHYTSVKSGANIVQALSRAVSLLKNTENKEQVQNILKDARAISPSLASKIYTLEAEWLNLHDFSDDAFTLLDDAINLFPNDTTLLYTRAMMIESFDFPQAEKDLRLILSLEPNNPTVQNALGYTLLLHTQRFDEAHQLIQSALNAEPEDPAILDSMGWVLHKMGRSNEALPYLKKAHALYSDPEVSSHLIQVYWGTGQKEKASQLLEASRKENPENPYLDEATQIINAK
ncbi:MULTISPECIES: tetratricopeptide repeat protein [unclassified Neptuniibacter]|uniref:tetratricopeptide repeat protein n=1 Tax=unclassified Neptuniibacter TaxID=2630693 RepID=UPI000C641F30|nr:MULTISPECIES: tetratricopeptide repeat protein [unclassified Neptuniibacter]MAY40926.1 hypothetical protein [Oceanospirillaceae bacterium]|tara:strand:+ start:2999 stop:4693 length:1695 start_codon:yes stop_codon:yes gene_type:complete